MPEQNGDEGHSSAAVLPPTGRPFAPGHDPRRNAGGRPKGLAAIVRQAVGNGEDLVQFYLAVFAGDAKAIGLRHAISLRDRMLAGEWLASRGWGRAPVVVELPDPPAGSFTPEQAAAVGEMPESLKQQIRRWLESRREEYIAQQRAEAEAKMRALLPGALGENGEGRNQSRTGRAGAGARRASPTACSRKATRCSASSSMDFGGRDHRELRGCPNAGERTVR